MIADKRKLEPYLAHDPCFCDTTREILARMHEEMYAHYEAGHGADVELVYWCEMIRGECESLYRTERFDALPEFDPRSDLN